MMSSSSPVAAALLSSTWDVFHNLTDSAHEMTLPCSKERHEASDAISPSAKMRFQIWKAVTDDVTLVGRGLISKYIRTTCLKLGDVGREGVKVVEASADGLLLLSQEENPVSGEGGVKRRLLSGAPLDGLLLEDGAALSGT